MSRWLPLESNPEVINKYVGNLGIKMEEYEFIDIYGLDDELLQMVPKPVLAVLLLFPISKEYRKYAQELQDSIQEKGQTVSPNLYYTKQTVQNACGTVALIHALANNRFTLNIEEGKEFANYLKETENLPPEERATYLETDTSFSIVHQESAQQGQTETPNIEDEVDLHFVAFIHKDDHLYELDGAKKSPINHGPSSDNTLLEDTARVVKKLMELNPNEVRFTLMGLAAKAE